MIDMLLWINIWSELGQTVYCTLQTRSQYTEAFITQKENIHVGDIDNN